MNYAENLHSKRVSLHPELEKKEKRDDRRK